MDFTWKYDKSGIDWYELAQLYKAAPFGEKLPADLEIVFANSRFMCFIYDGNRLIGVGRALADGKDCS